MLLSYGVGSAIVATSSPRPWRTFVFLGDGEEQEGNVAEAARHAASIQTRGLIATIDANGYQLSGPTGHADATDLAVTWRGYGWQVIELADGNDVLAVTAALRRGAALSYDGPVMILASTRKGYGIPARTSTSPATTSWAKRSHARPRRSPVHSPPDPGIWHPNGRP